MSDDRKHFRECVSCKDCLFHLDILVECNRMLRDRMETVVRLVGNIVNSGTNIYADEDSLKRHARYMLNLGEFSKEDIKCYCSLRDPLFQCPCKDKQ